MSQQYPEQFVEPAKIFENGIEITPSMEFQRAKAREARTKEYYAAQAEHKAYLAAQAAEKAAKQKAAKEQAQLRNVPTKPAPAPVAKAIPNPYAGGPSMADYAAQAATKAAKQKAANEQAAFNNIPKVSAAKRMKEGGSVSKGSSASKRADGIAQRGKTRGKMC